LAHAFFQRRAICGLSNTSKNTTFDDMLGQRTEHVMGRWTSSHPADIAWRREQMGFNNDIAGLARCPRAEQFVAELDAQGLGPADRRAALKEYFLRRAGEWSEQQPDVPTTSSKP
jgi:hypothetical protein